MSEFGPELSLLFFVALNIAVLASAWFFAARIMTKSRSQAVLDAALLGYAVQYAAVGLPGILHQLRMTTMAGTAMVFVLIFAAAGRNTKRPRSPKTPAFERYFITAIGLFTGTIILMYAKSQASLPVISNDAITYHFPAAVQWLQQGRIGLFQTWFFNPANTYSPLAGSMFIAWMIAPLGGDVLARFVEVPALFCVGIAMYRLCREMGVRVTVSALIAGAAMLARPIFLPCMMAKDDLFVAFFFITTLVALSPNRASERFGAWRFGIALGLLLATKYTALFVAPILLLAIDGPGWRIRRWTSVVVIVLLIAGPWYLRNWVLTGNPLFPMFSLFTTAASQSFHTWSGAINVILGGRYGLPLPVAILLGVGWVLSLRWGWSNPICRACVIGIMPGLTLFFFKSPFPEVRFVLPVFLLLFGCSAIAIDRCFAGEKLVIAAGFAVLLTALLTLFARSFLLDIAGFSAVGLLVVVFGLPAIWWSEDERLRRQAIVCMVLGMAGVYAYINWKAYCRNYRQTMFDDRGGYAVTYPDSNPLWRFVDQHVPNDATVAYTNMYLVYPLRGPTLQRQLVYAPTRPGVKSIADLGWLGGNLAGEQVVPAAARATVASPDRAEWLASLRRSDAKYLVIGNGGVIGVPPEAAFASTDPAQFVLLFEGTAGWVYRISDTERR